MNMQSLAAWGPSLLTSASSSPTSSSHFSPQTVMPQRSPTGEQCRKLWSCVPHNCDVWCLDPLTCFPSAFLTGPVHMPRPDVSQTHHIAPPFCAQVGAADVDTAGGG